MINYIFKRLLQIIPLLLVISFIVFFLIHLAPYDAIDAIVTPNMSQETVELMKQRYGLDQPFLIQYFKWLTEIFKGNMGFSLLNQQSISSELLTRIPNTMKLVIPSYLTALILSMILGLLAAANKGKWLDKIIDGICSIGISMPTFWFAMILIYFLGYKLNWLPIMGMQTIGKTPTLSDSFQHFLMPYLVLTVAFLPDLTRYIRTSALSQLNEDYVTVQQAFGATKWEIFVKHISRNVLIPVVTQIGQALPMLVTGAIITESIFGWPGVGPYMMTATKALDYPVIMAIMLLSATLVIVGNLLSDILYRLVDPRIRQEGGTI